MISLKRKLVAGSIIDASNSSMRDMKHLIKQKSEPRYALVIGVLILTILMLVFFWTIDISIQIKN